VGCAGSAEGGAAHRIGVPDRRGTAHLGDAGFVEVNMIKRGCAADFRGLAAGSFFYAVVAVVGEEICGVRRDMAFTGRV